MRRIVIVCDEMAAMLTKSKTDKKRSNEVAEITEYLELIAQQGRFAGIHLILATQRPDADAVPGQIKSNISYKLCGRADDVLSKIILDKTTAADEIPSDGEGLFLNQDDLLIKGYYLDE